MERLFEEDIRDAFRVYEIKKMQLFAKIIIELAGGQVNYSSLSKMVQVSDQTIKNWLTQLESFYFCFTIQPWSTNVMRSLIKEPKVYLCDWSLISDKGRKYENFIASHLLKAVQFWTDYGLGSYDLYYLRDKDQREVDFLITKNNQPWLMIEVKSSLKESLSKNLFHFQHQLNVPYVFQVAIEADFIEKDCFSIKGAPTIVPAKTLLSQLV
jgi:predicted AAA+ superfamily ATPase